MNKSGTWKLSDSMSTVSFVLRFGTVVHFLVPRIATFCHTWLKYFRATLPHFTFRVCPKEYANSHELSFWFHVPYQNWWHIYYFPQGFKETEWRIWNWLVTCSERRNHTDSTLMLESGMCIAGIFLSPIALEAWNKTWSNPKLVCVILT